MMGIVYLRDFMPSDKGSYESRTETEAIKALKEVLNTTIATVGDLLGKFVQAGMTNGLMGAVAVLWTNDILHEKGYISETGYFAVLSLTITSAGIDLAGTLIKDFIDILPWSQTTNTSFASPAIQVLVLGPQSTMPQLNSLLKG
jgi:hypothetical protein